MLFSDVNARHAVMQALFVCTIRDPIARACLWGVNARRRVLHNKDPVLLEPINFNSNKNICRFNAFIVLCEHKNTDKL